MTRNAAVDLLARMLFGIGQTAPIFVGAGPDLQADFFEIEEHGVTTVVTVGSGDTYRVTVEWLPEESP